MKKSNISKLCYIYNNQYGAYCNFKEVNGRVGVHFNREKGIVSPIIYEQAEAIIDRLESEQPEITGQFQIRKG